MDVKVDLKGYAAETSCKVEIYFDTVLVFDDTVEPGTTEVVLDDLSGLGSKNLVVVINGTESWEQWVDFV